MLTSQLQADLAAALKAGDRRKVDTLRFLLGAIFNFQIEKGKDYVANDSEVLGIIAKQIKTHKESIEMFAKAGRGDLVEKEEEELKILQSYLPAQMGEEEVRAKIRELVAANSQADFGTIMKLAMAKLQGKAEGAMVAKIVREVLGA